ncbi:Uncharacterised protein [Pseudomonas aeruginosa]|nr:Uncharacterised protein [Pseudomonas aeruginosa]
MLLAGTLGGHTAYTFNGSRRHSGSTARNSPRRIGSSLR